MGPLHVSAIAFLILAAWVLLILIYNFVKPKKKNTVLGAQVVGNTTHSTKLRILANWFDHEERKGRHAEWSVGDNSVQDDLRNMAKIFDDISDGEKWLELVRFKEHVQKRLDEVGIPKYPKGAQEDCLRNRLEILIAGTQSQDARELNELAMKIAQNVVNDGSWSSLYELKEQFREARRDKKEKKEQRIRRAYRGY